LLDVGEEFSYVGNELCLMEYVTTLLYLLNLYYFSVFKYVKMNPEILLELVTMRMPFGKYKDYVLCNLPVSYLEWFEQKGFPAGKLGILLQTMLEIKMNGLEYLLEPLKKRR